MNRTLTQNQLAGRAIGALFFSAFGALWLGLALYALQQLTVTSVAAILLVLVNLVAAALYLMRQSRRFPRLPEDPALSRAFNRINAAQWVAIGIVAFSFARLHLDAYVLCAITAIVGLHMFPLARLFRYRPHYVTGTVLVAWAAVSAFAAPLEHLQGVSALGTGLILWLSAMATLALAINLAGQPAGLSQPPATGSSVPAS